MFIVRAIQIFTSPFSGETGAGKSTLLNLLLGELATNLLPVAHLSSTSAITEIKYCPYGKLVVHHRDPSIKERTYDLDAKNAAETIAKHVHQMSKLETNAY